MLTGFWPETEQSSAGQGKQSHLPETTGMVIAKLQPDKKAFQYKAKGRGWQKGQGKRRQEYGSYCWVSQSWSHSLFGESSF